MNTIDITDKTPFSCTMYTRLYHFRWQYAYGFYGLFTTISGRVELVEPDIWYDTKEAAKLAWEIIQ